MCDNNGPLAADIDPCDRPRSTAGEDPGKFDFGDPDRRASSADLCQLLLALANQ